MGLGAVDSGRHLPCGDHRGHHADNRLPVPRRLHRVDVRVGHCPLPRWLGRRPSKCRTTPNYVCSPACCNSFPLAIPALHMLLHRQVLLHRVRRGAARLRARPDRNPHELARRVGARFGRVPISAVVVARYESEADVIGHREGQKTTYTTFQRSGGCRNRIWALVCLKPLTEGRVDRGCDRYSVKPISYRQC